MSNRSVGPAARDAVVRPRGAGERRGRLREEAGFTLNELLLAMVLAVIVVGGPLSFIIYSLNQQNSVSSRTFAASDAEAGLALLTHDLRAAQYIADSSGADSTPVAISNGGATISFYLANSGSPSLVGSQVTWTCTVGSNCTRKVGAATATAQIRGVTSATFSGTSSTGATGITANPAFVGIKIGVQVTNLADHTATPAALAGTSNAITLQDGVALRNYS